MQKLYLKDREVMMVAIQNEIVRNPEDGYTFPSWFLQHCGIDVLRGYPYPHPCSELVEVALIKV